MADDKDKDKAPNKDDKDDDSSKDDPDAGAKKALEAERKARKAAEKKQQELETQLKDITDKDKSEVDKLRDELEQTKADAKTASEKALRLEIGVAKGLTPTQARRLVGSTQEELETDADELLEAFGHKADEDKSDPVNSPKPSLRGGSDPSQDADVDVREIVEKIPRGVI